MNRATALKPKLTRVEGHVTTAGKVATAWYVVPSRPTAFKAPAEMDRIIRAGALSYSELVGRRVRWRSTGRPLTPDQWRARLLADADTPLPGYHRVVDWQAARLQHLDLAEPVVYLGIDVQKRASRWIGFKLWQDHTVAEIDRIVAGEGWRARPATFDEIDWLVRSSLALGHPVDLPPALDAPYEGGDEGDMAELGRPLWWTDTAYAQSVNVGVNGAVRHVAVSRSGRMRSLDSDGYGPWMCKAAGIGFPVEMAAVFDVKPISEVESRVRKFIRQANSQIHHFVDEHGKPAPMATVAAQRRGLEVEAELDDPDDLSVRCYGWVDFAVSDDTEAGALTKAKAVSRRFAPGINVYTPAHDQYDLALGFIPGQVDTPKVKYSRREVPALTAAGGLPHAVAKIGDRSGFYQGWTTGMGNGQRAAFWQPWASMEERKGPGLNIECGDLGGGKSFHVAANTFLAAMSGAICVVLDGSPAGLLGNLCYLPELRERAVHVDMQRSQTPGQYNPWYLVPTPRRDDFDEGHIGYVQWTHACDQASAHRRALAVDDVIMMMTDLPTPDERRALVKAAMAASKTKRPSLRVMLEKLEDRDLAAYLLDEVAMHPGAQVFFDSGTELDWRPQIEDPVLTVVTLGGLSLPPENKPRSQWTSTQRYGLLQLTSAAWQVYRILYGTDRNARKWAFYDEAQALARTEAGQTVMQLPAEDARKHDLRLNVACHSMLDLANCGFDTLIDSIFGFNTSGPDAQRALLEAMHVPTGGRFEPTLATLADRTGGTRDCVWSDGMGGVERITIDRDMVPHHVQDALESTADPTKVRRRAPSNNGERVPA